MDEYKDGAAGNGTTGAAGVDLDEYTDGAADDSTIEAAGIDLDEYTSGTIGAAGVDLEEYTDVTTEVVCWVVIVVSLVVVTGSYGQT